MAAKNSSFSKRVKEIVKNIPAGKVLSYSEVARLAGSPKAARVVGNLMSKNYDASIPCHRVIRSNGEIANYNRGGSEAKLKLLIEEGYTPKHEQT